MFRKEEVYTILVPLTLVLLLVGLHAPGLFPGFPTIDRTHDFWGGLLVEMIGVCVEISLIMFVLTRLQEIRWGPVRYKIKKRIYDELYQEFNSLDLLLGSDGVLPDRSIKQIESEFNKWSEKSRERETQLSSYLQHTNVGFTPEMSDLIAGLMSQYVLFPEHFRMGKVYTSTGDITPQEKFRNVLGSFDRAFQGIEALERQSRKIFAGTDLTLRSRISNLKSQYAIWKDRADEKN